MDERPDSSQQLMDILLVMDEKGTLQAVSGVKDGELQTKNPLEDNNDLLRVDRHGDMFSNFFSNLWNQLKDPTRFHFFRVPEEEVQRVAADFRQRESQSVKTGEQVEALVSRNLKTNELVAFPLSKVNIPAEKNGHTFTPDEIARLKQGEAVVCQFLSRAKEGEQPKLYPAPVQFSAAKMQLEFLFGDRGRLAMDAYKANLKQTANQEVPKTFRKQELTEKSRLELEAGGTVKVSGLVDKKGKAYQGYITWKPGEKPAFMFPKDYKAALEEGRVKPAVENEVQVAVNSEGKTVEATRNLKEALQSAQQRPTGEQKQQQERRQEQKEDRKQAQKQEQPDKPKRSRGVRR